ncbi:hypothetical protein F5ESL0236_08280 [Lactobacillus sp. ESL0236]|nr:hypothetical protein F5ESL0237_07540 [Lactobacillus sp. ESL0237]RMC42442.1 hypothetical protein F5ESL0234_08180 [Lactobacillus sp. ESL0234]RMC42607.1 hypothetical protein F5ESL0236_08280 [Lactobacillus sp. ESL0236]
MILQKLPINDHEYKWTSDWGSIYSKIWHERADQQYEYDCEHGVGAFQRKEQEELQKAHQFFVDFEKKYMGD